MIWKTVWSLTFPLIPWAEKIPSQKYKAPAPNNLGLEPILRSRVMYNASAVKIYNAASSLVRFENKNIIFHYEKRYNPTKTREL
jgi:hypothetical protein